MAKLDFPSAASSPFTAPNGVTYTYIGTEPNGHWSGTEADGSTSLQSQFVEVAGDNMTGDLTLGTDKITLDATAGSITAAGTFYSTNTSASGAAAFLLANPSDVSQNSGGLYQKDGGKSVLSLRNGWGTSATVSILGEDGTAAFVNGDISLNPDGSITAADAIQSGGNPDNGSANGAQLRSAGAIYASREANKAIFSGYTTGDISPKLALYSDGSAEFAGNITAEKFIGDGSQLTNLPGGSGGGAYLPLTGGTLTGDLSLERNDVENVLLSNAGSIKFSGAGAGEVFISAQTAGAGGYYKQTLDAGASGGVWRIQDSNSDDIALVNADGSGEFKGGVRVGDAVESASSTFSNIDPSGQIYLQNNVGDDTKIVFGAFNGSFSTESNRKIMMYASGSASFSGTVTATTFNIDALPALT